MTAPPRPSVSNLEPQISHTDALPAGARISEFEILSLLGVGGFGMVYRAYDHSLHRTVAIKEYMPSALAGRSQVQAVSARSSSDHETLVSGLRSFVNEARLLAQFDHPSLVKVYRFWEANNTAYMVMPLYSGMTLRQVRSQMRTPPPEAWLRTVLWAILGALKYLHENNIVHRDVSPDNIFLQDIGPPVLLDMGAARRAISDTSQKYTAILKVNYAPIEQYADAIHMRQGPWTDLYSVAAVVHGCLCNEPPVPATFRVLRDGMPTFASVAQTIQTHYGQHYSREFVQTIGHALAIQPQDRPQNVQAFFDEMALIAPDDIQRFAWRECLATVPSLDLPGAPTGATQPPHLKTTQDLRPAKPTTLDLRPTLGHAAEAASSGATAATVLGPLETDNKSLTTESIFSGLAAPTIAASVASEDAPDVMAGANAGTNAGVETVVKAVVTNGIPEPRKSLKARKYGAAAALALVLVAAFAYWNWGDKTPLKAPVAVEVVPPVNETVLPAAEKAAVLPNQANETVVPAKAAVTDSNAEMILETESKSRPMAKSAASSPARAASADAIKKPAATVVKSTEAIPGKLDPAISAIPAIPVIPVIPVIPAVAEESRPVAVPERRGPDDICADRNFITRPMCIFKECEKPTFAGLPFCVENRRRLQENNSR